jgi:uncharacterized membrane protein YccC
MSRNDDWFLVGWMVVGVFTLEFYKPFGPFTADWIVNGVIGSILGLIFGYLFARLFRFIAKRGR